MILTYTLSKYISKIIKDLAKQSFQENYTIITCNLTVTEDDLIKSRNILLYTSYNQIQYHR